MGCRKSSLRLPKVNRHAPHRPPERRRVVVMRAVSKLRPDRNAAAPRALDFARQPLGDGLNAEGGDSCVGCSKFREGAAGGNSDGGRPGLRAASGRTPRAGRCGAARTRWRATGFAASLLSARIAPAARRRSVGQLVEGIKGACIEGREVAQIACRSRRAAAFGCGRDIGKSRIHFLIKFRNIWRINLSVARGKIESIIFLNLPPYPIEWAWPPFRIVQAVIRL